MKEKTLTDPREMRAGQKISFMYNNKERIGHVSHVDSRYFTVDHTNPAQYDGKRFSNYRFLSLGSRIRVV